MKKDKKTKKDKKQKLTLLKDAGIKFKEHIVNEKQLVIVYFDFEYPMTAEDIKQVTQVVSNIVNEDRRFVNRCIFLPKGFDMYNLSEADFLEIWRSKVDEEVIQKEIHGLSDRKPDDEVPADTDPNQTELFPEEVEHTWDNENLIEPIEPEEEEDVIITEVKDVEEDPITGRPINE